jgi:hypothetical protein
VHTLSAIVDRLRIEQRIALGAWRVWDVLLDLLRLRRSDLFESTTYAIKVLASGSSGRDYAEFLENHLFEKMMACLPRPDLITLDVPIRAEAKPRFVDCTALGTTWSAFLSVYSSASFRLRTVFFCQACAVDSSHRQHRPDINHIWPSGTSHILSFLFRCSTPPLSPFHQNPPTEAVTIRIDIRVVNENPARTRRCCLFLLLPFSIVFRLPLMS